MSELTRLIGTRIRGYRKMRQLSQEQLAEKCGLHPTYIGQLERGEKNATLDSIQSVCIGLQISLEQLFSGIVPSTLDSSSYIPNRVNALLTDLSRSEQLIVYNLIVEALKLKS